MSLRCKAIDLQVEPARVSIDLLTATLLFSTTQSHKFHINAGLCAIAQATSTAAQRPVMAPVTQLSDLN